MQQATLHRLLTAESASQRKILQQRKNSCVEKEWEGGDDDVDVDVGCSECVLLFRHSRVASTTSSTKKHDV
ncbi:hypothetical protein V9T40_014036 [Parthenolecanium corni]|uniref:Uncharacterized protein n=1 Tax=Parthenolecanium corni TaxID=536013 RepID=A0AAN9TC00_9HEMI